MRVEAKKYLHDMSHAVGLLDGFCAGKSFADHERDAKVPNVPPMPGDEKK